MKLTAFLSALCLLVALGQSSPAKAITYGEPDEGRHPYVGMVLVLAGDQPLTFCSGTLIAPTVFLTAAHCLVGADLALVWFDDEIERDNLPPPVSGQPFMHPDYDDFASFPNNNDVGIVELDWPVSMTRYGELPNMGILDNLATQRGRKNELMTLVGYGLGTIYPFTPLEPPALLERRVAESMLVNLRNALTDGYNLQTSGHPGEGLGNGGICRGDSGGPVLLGETDIVVGIISFGQNAICRGVGFHTRVDIESSMTFIESFLP
jgi:hypothetical protein